MTILELNVKMNTHVDHTKVTQILSRPIVNFPPETVATNKTAMSSYRKLCSRLRSGGQHQLASSLKLQNSSFGDVRLLEKPCTHHLASALEENMPDRDRPFYFIIMFIDPTLATTYYI
jgi:hypothetical protein